MHHANLARLILNLESNWTLLFLEIDNNGNGFTICHDSNDQEYVAFHYLNYEPDTGIAKHQYSLAKDAIEAYKKADFEKVISQ